MNKNYKQFILLLALFIGLGLPDSLLSTTWPNISVDLNINVSYISLFSIITIFCSTISTSNTYKLNKLFGVTNVIIFSMICCLIGLINFIVFKSFTSLIITQIIMGLGAGAIDSNVNFIASQTLKVGQINVLHGFWGVGITLSPLITSIVYQLGFSQWIVFMIISLFFIILIIYTQANRTLLDIELEMSNSKLSKVKLKLVDYLPILIHFVYGVEFLIGTYLATYTVTYLKINSSSAALLVAVYWAGVMISRIIMPIIFKYVKSTKVLLLHAIILIICSGFVNSHSFSVLAVTYGLIGYAFGPIFPTFVHFTELVHKENTSFFIGKQISSMYIAIFLSQVLVGGAAIKYGFSFFSPLIMILIIILASLIICYLHLFKSKLV